VTKCGGARACPVAHNSQQSRIMMHLPEQGGRSKLIRTRQVWKATTLGCLFARRSARMFDSDMGTPRQSTLFEK
jgi:hypothetical protein